MPMHISPSIDMSSDRTATMCPRMSPIANSLPPATQSDILGILQREQDRAIALLSSSPLLASLFVSYANQAAAFESYTPPAESEEWKALENTISRLQEEVDKLKPENLEITERLVAAGASLEAFRSQVTSLKEVNVVQRLDIGSLQAELFESKDKYNRLVEDSNAERDVLQNTVSDLKIQQAELKETIVMQQLKPSKVGPGTAPRTSTECPHRSKQDGDKEVELEELRKRKRQEKAEREARRMEQREERFTDSEQGLSPSKPAHPSLAPEVSPDAFPNSTLELPKAPQGVKGEVPGTPKLSAVEKNNDHRRKTPGLSQKEHENERGGSLGFGSAEKKDESHGLPPTITSSVPGGIFDGAGNFEVELRTPVTKKGNKGIDTPSNHSKVAAPSETVDMGKSDNPSQRVSISSENECFTDAEQTPSPPEPAHPALAPGHEPFPNSTSELLKTPQGAKPASCLTPQISTPARTPVKTEPEKPLSLWERKKLRTQSISASIMFSDDATNPSGTWGDAGGTGSTETIAMPAVAGNGDRQSIFTDTARDQKRGTQRENLIEGFLSSNQGRRRNDSA